MNINRKQRNRLGELLATRNHQVSLGWRSTIFSHDFPPRLFVLSLQLRHDPYACWTPIQDYLCVYFEAMQFGSPGISSVVLATEKRTKNLESRNWKVHVRKMAMFERCVYYVCSRPISLPLSCDLYDVCLGEMSKTILYFVNGCAFPRPSPMFELGETEKEGESTNNHKGTIFLARDIPSMQKTDQWRAGFVNRKMNQGE